MTRLTLGLLLVSVLAVPARAQSIARDWEGTLKVGPAELRLVVHITGDPKGSLSATMDSPDQGVSGIPVTSISLSDSTLRFEIQKINGKYEGKVSPDGSAIRGTWTQGGNDFPLDLTPAAPKPDPGKRVAKPSDIDGAWEGSVEAGGQTLRLVLHVKTYEDGMTATLDSIDQGVKGLPVTTISRDGAKLKFEMKQIAGSYDGTIDKELKTIGGTWTQAGNSMPLTWTRVAAPK